MTNIECWPKLKLYDLITSIKDGICDVNSINDSHVYLTKEINIPINDFLESILKKEVVDDYIKEKIKDIDFFMNDHLYQGCLIYGSGHAKDYTFWKDLLEMIKECVSHARTDIRNSNDIPENLRPTILNLIKKGRETNLQIKLLFIFTHNKKIKAYFYNAPEKIHILSLKLSLKYIKANLSMRREEFFDGVKIYFFDRPDDISEEFTKKLEQDLKYTYPIAILCKRKETYERLLQFTENVKLTREFIIQDSWM